MTFNPRWIIGKTVARVEMNPFQKALHGERHGIAHNPEIFFTDGSSIGFATEETEVGDYGTDIRYRKPQEGARQ